MRLLRALGITLSLLQAAAVLLVLGTLAAFVLSVMFGVAPLVAAIVAAMAVGLLLAEAGLLR